MPLAVQPITPAVAALAADLGVALKPGSVVSAQVMKILDANLVRIAIGNLMLDATTMNPLQQGQKLQLAVGQTANAMTLTPVAGDAALSSGGASVSADDIPLAPKLLADQGVQTALTPQETRAVSIAAQGAVTKQAGLSPLFANLQAAVDAGELPEPVATAAAQLLDLRQSAKTITGDGIRAALQSSGLMFEAARTQSASTPAPDLKSALLVLRQALSTWLGDTDAAPTPSSATTVTPAGRDGSVGAALTPNAGSARAASAEPVLSAVQSLMAQAKGDTAASGSKNLLAMQMIASEAGLPNKSAIDRPTRSSLIPPFRGGLPSAQPVASPSLPSDADPASVARQLIADTDGALARQTLLQVASLPDRIDQQNQRSDPAQPRWNFEIPFATPQGTAMAQFEIARDGGSGQDHAAAQRTWQARFSLDIEPAGPIHALITYGGDATNVKMWAERPATAAQLRTNVGQLSASLDRADLKAGDIVVADGAPSQARSPSAGHFLNRAT